MNFDTDPYAYRFCPFFPDGLPVLVQMPGIEAKFVAVFTDVEKLHASMSDLSITGYVIKQITDSLDFLGSIREVGCRIMGDPYVVEGNRTRWYELTDRPFSLEQLRNLRHKEEFR